MTWFILRPRFIPQIFQILRRKKNSSLENSRIESTEWCKLNSLDKEEALKRLSIDIDINEFEKLYKEEIEKAKGLENECPVKMGGEGAISFLYCIVKAVSAKNIIETGVAYGWSSFAILLAIKDESDSFLISNDMPYIKMNNDDYVGYIIPNAIKDKWLLQREPDITGIQKAINKFKDPIDLFHYDSDKSYTGRMWSSPIIWESLRSGGVFISDDINDNLAFKHFAEKVNKEPVIIEHKGKYVGVLIK